MIQRKYIILLPKDGYFQLDFWRSKYKAFCMGTKINRNK